MKLIRKCRDSDAIESLKISVFTNILMQPAGDMTRYVRNIKSIIGSEYQDEFLKEQQEIAADVHDSLPDPGQVDTSAIRQVVRANDKAVQDLESSMDKALTNVRRNETKNKPIQLAEKASAFLESIDTHIILKMSKDERQKLAHHLDKIDRIIDTIRENM